MSEKSQIRIGLVLVLLAFCGLCSSLPTVMRADLAAGIATLAGALFGCWFILKWMAAD